MRRDTSPGLLQNHLSTRCGSKLFQGLCTVEGSARLPALRAFQLCTKNKHIKVAHLRNSRGQVVRSRWNWDRRSRSFCACKVYGCGEAERVRAAAVTEDGLRTPSISTKFLKRLDMSSCYVCSKTVREFASGLSESVLPYLKLSKSVGDSDLNCNCYMGLD